MELLKNASDIEFWKKIRNKPECKELIEETNKMYEQYCVGEIASAKFSEFRLFNDCGDREIYQKNFFHRQHRLYAVSIMALLYPENEEYITLLQDTLWDVCDQYVWALPAHIKNIEENNNAVLDLDATTMSMAIAMIKVMLGERLHPLIRSRIDAEIDRRLIKPFFSQTWHWENSYNNWSSVCAGATGCTIMLNRPELFGLARDRLNECMRKYIASYGEDGVCVEGAGYWSYGFGYFIEYADMLKKFTNGECDLLNNSKVKNIATFLQKLYLDTDVVVSYGDCPMNASFSAGLMYKLKSLFPEEFEIPPKANLNADIHYYPFAVNAFLCNDASSCRKVLSNDGEYYMQDAGWYVRRTQNYGFSARGGFNGESHNHNDTGSFIFAHNNKQIFCDMGSGTYTKDYFSERRYTYIETSSRGHNLPIINGKYQDRIGLTDPPHSKTSLKDGAFYIDFGEIYGIDELKSLVRECRCDEKGVRITDRFSLNEGGTFTERLVTFIKPEIADGKIIVDGVSVKFDGNAAKASYKTDRHITSRNADGSVKTFEIVYLIDINVINPQDKFSFEIEVESNA